MTRKITFGARIDSKGGFFSPGRWSVFFGIANSRGFAGPHGAAQLCLPGIDGVRK